MESQLVLSFWFIAGTGNARKRREKVRFNPLPSSLFSSLAPKALFLNSIFAFCNFFFPCALKWTTPFLRRLAASPSFSLTFRWRQHPSLDSPFYENSFEFTSPSFDFDSISHKSFLPPSPLAFLSRALIADVLMLIRITFNRGKWGRDLKRLPVRVECELAYPSTSGEKSGANKRTSSLTKGFYHRQPFAPKTTTNFSYNFFALEKQPRGRLLGSLPDDPQLLEKSLNEPLMLFYWF